MHSTLLTLGALAGVVAAGGGGRAIVKNACSYPIHLCNTPAQGGGFDSFDTILDAGKSYDQVWTKLNNDQGWSIKLSKDGDYQHNVLQYEYTCHDDGQIWYDLSEVDGNPFSKDWDISADADSGCHPEQVAYRFWNDDEHGMQSTCSDTADITLTLCSSSGPGNSTGSAPAQSPAPAPAYPAPAPSSASPAPAAPSYGSQPLELPIKQKQQGEGASPPTPTTLATHPVKDSNDGGYVATVFDVVTKVQTAYVTAPADTAHGHVRRHQHHGPHAHHH